MNLLLYFGATVVYFGKSSLGCQQPRERQTFADTVPTVTRHIQEIEMIRGKVYSLEQQHQQMKAKYVSFFASAFVASILPQVPSRVAISDFW